ncbi:hypothetical protein [Desulfocurvus sp. DL9XJH121]
MKVKLAKDAALHFLPTGKRTKKKGEVVDWPEDLKLPPWAVAVEDEAEEAAETPAKNATRKKDQAKKAKASNKDLEALRKDADELGIQWQEDWDAAALTAAIAEALGSGKTE